MLQEKIFTTWKFKYAANRLYRFISAKNLQRLVNALYVLHMAKQGYDRASKLASVHSEVVLRHYT